MELCRRADNDNDTCVGWAKDHKGIKGNEGADKLSGEASILGHESEGGGHAGRPQSMEQTGEGRCERRKRRRHTGVAP